VRKSTEDIQDAYEEFEGTGRKKGDEESYSNAFEEEDIDDYLT